MAKTSADSQVVPEIDAEDEAEEGLAEYTTQTEDAAPAAGKARRPVASISRR